LEVNPNDRFAFYLRKSRADMELERLGEGETLARHAAMLEQLAHRHGISMEQVDVYREVVSGESISDRPEMQKLLKAVSKRQYKAVLVVEIERLARGNTSDQGQVADAFVYSGTLIITPAKVFDPASEADQEYFEFGLFMSRREYKTIRRRLQAGKLAAIQEGQWIANWTPYGYKAVRNGKKDKHLEIVPEEAEVVRQIFRLHQDGITPHTIARRLTEQGIKPPRNAEQWHKSTITRILQNPVYIGKIRWANATTVRQLADDGRTIKRRIKSANPIIVDGKHQPIITEAEFNLNQGAFSASSPVPECWDMVNPLCGLLRCLKCHRAMVYVPPGKKVPRAKYSHKNAFNCQQHSADAELVMKSVIQGLQNTLKNVEVQAKQQGQDNNAAELKRLTNSLSREQAKLKRIYDSYESGVYSPDEFLSRRQQAQSAIAKVQSAIDQLNSITPKVNHDEQIKRLHDVIAMLGDDSIPAKERNRFAKSIIKTIWYNNDGEQMTLDIETL